MQKISKLTTEESEKLYNQFEEDAHLYLVNANPNPHSSRIDPDKIPESHQHALVMAIRRERERLTPLLRIAEEARKLVRSGYDGEFMGEAIAPLFDAVAEWEKHELDK